MFVPFVFEPFRNHLWIFHKSLGFVQKTHSAILAMEMYYNTLISTLRKENHGVVASQELISLQFMYQIPTDKDLEYSGVFQIPREEIDTVVLEQGSISDAYSYLLTEPDKKLCNFLERFIEKIELDYGEKIEAFISFGNEVKSLAVTARDRNIPVIHWELGCWRYPKYLNTAYWDLDGSCQELCAK